ncbi:MAG: hypothetical protein Q3965_04650 [Rothia sp. (in: high G+C Gram-positive bacteria)]|nr:hypothetical protein [Rothia sp. (in: high G+C Gram-positive bacteria)]
MGNADFDLACVAVDALIQDAQLTEETVLALMPATRRPAPEFLHAAVIALAGYYLFASTLPPHGSTNTSLIEMRARRAAALLTRLSKYHHSFEETDYLMQSPANASRLLSAIEELRAERGKA